MTAEILKKQRLQNDFNLLKYNQFVSDSCRWTFQYVYEHLYSWPNGDPSKIAQYLDDDRLTKVFSKGTFEYGQLIAMSKDASVLKRLNIDILYKLIMHGTNHDKIKSPDDDVWTENCPRDYFHNLEHLLYRVKNHKELFKDKDYSVDHLTDDDVLKFNNSIYMRLTGLIREVGMRIDGDRKEIDNVCDELTLDIINIRKKDEFSASEKKQIAARMNIEDVHYRYLDRLNESIKTGEVKNYSPPNFQRNSDGKEFSFKDFFDVAVTQMVVICSDVEQLKTSLCNYVFHQALIKSKDQIPGLEKYDFVFKINCNSVTTSDSIQFFESELSGSLECMPNSTSFLRYIDTQYVLYILDCFELATEECQLLLVSLMRRLNQKHKIIVTSHPDAVKDIEETIQSSFNEDSELKRVNVEIWDEHLISGEETDDIMREFMLEPVLRVQMSEYYIK